MDELTNNEENKEREIRALVNEELRNLFYRLGSDLTNPVELRNLVKDLEYLREKREHEELRSVNAIKVVWLLVTALIGSAATLGSEWLRNHLPHLF